MPEDEEPGITGPQAGDDEAPGQGAESQDAPLEEHAPGEGDNDGGALAGDGSPAEPLAQDAAGRVDEVVEERFSQPLPEDRDPDSRASMVRRRWLEMGTAAAGTVGAVLAVLGALAVLYGRGYHDAGVLALATAVGMLIASQAFSFNISTYRFVGGKSRGSPRFERLQRWTRLKTTSSLHSLLVMLGLLVIGIAVLSRLGMFSVALTGQQSDRALALFLALFVVNGVFAHHQSLFVQLDADRSAGTRTLFWAGINLAALLGGFAAYVDFYQVTLRVGALALQPADALVVLVAAFTLQGVLLSLSRGLPSILSVMSDPRTQIRGGYISRTKAVAMPTIVAFTLLMVFVLLMFVFGAGIFTVLGEAGRSPSVLLVLAVMVLAVIVGLTISLMLVRQEDKVELFRVRRSREQRIQIGIVVGSLSLAATLIIMALFTHNGGMGPFSQERWIHFASLGMLVALGPYGFYAARRHRRIQQMETRFPDLLRDLASSHKGGLTLVQASQVAARGDYGILSPEVQRLADQLTWNVSFDEAFSRFADRVQTPLVRRSVNLVLEAGRSGGNTTDVLLTAARDAREIKSLERERAMNMSVYTTVIYVTFFVFLFVIGILVSQFLPAITAAGEAAAASRLDPATTGLNLSGVGDAEYRRFYFIAGSVQAIGNGMLAGIMGNGSGTLGLRHAFFMVLATYIAFAFIL